MALNRRKFKANPIKTVKLSAVLADFTDSGGTTGTLDFTGMTMPLGCAIQGVKIIGGDFSGDTTASVDVGNNVGVSWLLAVQTGFAASYPVTAYSLPGTEAASLVSTVTQTIPRITITGAAAFASIAADPNAKTRARVYVEVYYVDLNARSS